MNMLFNSQERTLNQWVALTVKGGWKVEEVRKNGLFAHMIASPSPRS